MATVREQAHYRHAISVAANKRDVLAAFTCLLFFAPLILTIYLLVRADGRRAFVSHERIGRDGAIFEVWSFRTTKRETPRKFRSSQTAPESPAFTMLGRVLHRTQLDLLPGFYSVLKGDMSLAEMTHDY